jgi:hypothetical protein
VLHSCTVDANVATTYLEPLTKKKPPYARHLIALVETDGAMLCSSFEGIGRFNVAVSALVEHHSLPVDLNINIKGIGVRRAEPEPRRMKKNPESLIS